MPESINHRRTIKERLAYEPTSEVEMTEHESKGEAFKTFEYLPENPVSEVPLVISWGWATTHDTIAPYADMLAQEGRRVIVVDETPKLTVETGESAERNTRMMSIKRKLGKIAAEQLGRENSWAEIPEIEEEEDVPDELPDRPYLNRNVDLIEQAIDDYGFEKVDIVTHSQGSILSRLYADRQPDKIRSIVDTAPAGKSRQGSKLKQVAAAATEQVRMLGRLTDKGAYRDMAQQARFLLGNSKNAAGQQAEIADTYDADSNFMLRSRGVKLGLVSFHADAFFPPQDIIEDDALDRGQGGRSRMGRYDAVASFRRPMAGHNQMFADAEESAAAVAEMLSSINGEPMNLEVRDPSLSEINKERRRVRVARFASKLLLDKDRDLVEADFVR